LGVFFVVFVGFNCPVEDKQDHLEQHKAQLIPEKDNEQVTRVEDKRAQGEMGKIDSEMVQPGAQENELPPASQKQGYFSS
jgi:hypothetical protein